MPHSIQTEAAESLSDDGLYKSLQAFGKGQFSYIDQELFKTNSANLTASISFLAGAIRAMAEHAGLDEYDPAQVLQRYIMAKFNMPRANARGIIESSQRLASKYTFLDDAFREGKEAAAVWCQDENTPLLQLNAFLQQHDDITMSDLGKKGVISEEPANEPVAVETVVEEVNVPVVSSPGMLALRRPQVVFWLIAVVLIVAMNYALLRVLL